MNLERRNNENGDEEVRVVIDLTWSETLEDREGASDFRRETHDSTVHAGSASANATAWAELEDVSREPHCLGLRLPTSLRYFVSVAVRFLRDRHQVP